MLSRDMSQIERKTYTIRPVASGGLELYKAIVIASKRVITVL